MTKIILIALTVVLISGAASAATNGDHGGFGRDLFATRAPAGFQDPRDYANNMDVAAQVANQMAPAAGGTGAAHR